MKRLHTLFLASLALVATARPVTLAADQVDPMACTITVDYALNNTSRLTYTKAFVVGIDSPYSDDFSTATRFRTFDATLTNEGGTPVVNAAFDADVSVFNAVAFRTILVVTDPTHGSTTNGRNAFFSSAPGAAGSHITSYQLTCQRAN